MTKIRLDQLEKGQKAMIFSVQGNPNSSGLKHRLLEMGFLKGSSVELVHVAPFGGDPIAVRVRGGLIALRKSEASLVEVEVLSHG